MNFLALLILSVLISFDSSSAQQDGTFYKNTKINGHAGLRKDAAEDAAHGSQLVRSRRSDVSATIQPCYRPFFASNTPPTGFDTIYTNLRYICQQLPLPKKDYFYSTMFDLDYGIPIYSAYVVSQTNANNFGTAGRPSGSDVWRQEINGGITKQASDETYADQSTNAKGHLLPAETYSFDQDAMDSTFTYTNAVPQVARFNSGPWALYEKRIRKYATDTCSNNGGKLFLITGISKAVISQNAANELEAKVEELKTMKTGISIPRSMWTAGCCITVSGAVGNFAVVGNNRYATTDVLRMFETTVKGLQDLLLTGVILFPSNPGCSDSSKQVKEPISISKKVKQIKKIKKIKKINNKPKKKIKFSNKVKKIKMIKKIKKTPRN